MTSDEFQKELAKRGLPHNLQEQLMLDCSAVEVARRLLLEDVQVGAAEAEGHARALRATVLKYLKA